MLSTHAGGELVSGIRVSDGFFRTLGITPLLGRDFYPGEDLPGTPNTVILSYGAWQNRFGGSKDIVGQTVTLSGVPNTVIGVLPREFQFAPRGVRSSGPRFTRPATVISGGVATALKV